MNEGFLSGVVEGFYGKPWTQDQRLTLFDRMVNWGLNTYFYSPKDDLKHRAKWRATYTDSELESIQTLVANCQQRGLRFIFGLSPGLDIVFSDASELQLIQARLQQMLDIGVSDFTLLFDDLPGKINETDQQAFASVASAQAHVTNSTLEWLRSRGSNGRLLFCPTPYCDRMVSWQLGGEGYLETIGRELHADIDVLWTGPEIISSEITVESIQSLTTKIGRRPVIWDNLHANDYDMRRLYCGPYSGRSRELLKHVRGILSNPNNEFPINYIPLRTLAEYVHQPDYNPRNAYLAAVTDWAKLHETLHGQIAADDLLLLADCYYLPNCEGEKANELQSLIATLLESPVAEWGDAYDKFIEKHARVIRLFEQMTELNDRDLFYAWSRRVWDLREELDLLKDFVNHKQSGNATDFASETHLQNTYRGGTVARLQRRLQMDESGSFRVR